MGCITSHAMTPLQRTVRSCAPTPLPQKPLLLAALARAALAAPAAAALHGLLLSGLHPWAARPHQHRLAPCRLLHCCSAAQTVRHWPHGSAVPLCDLCLQGAWLRQLPWWCCLWQRPGRAGESPLLQRVRACNERSLNAVLICRRACHCTDHVAGSAGMVRAMI